MNSVSPLAWILLASLICFALGCWVMRPRWTQVKVDSTGRGPNADSHYQMVIVEGVEYWFTEEQLATARGRATSYSRA